MNVLKTSPTMYVRACFCHYAYKFIERVDKIL